MVKCLQFICFNALREYSLNQNASYPEPRYFSLKKNTIKAYSCIYM